MSYIAKWRMEYRGHKTRCYFTPEVAIEAFHSMCLRNKMKTGTIDIRWIGDDSLPPKGHAVLRQINVKEVR